MLIGVSARFPTLHCAPTRVQLPLGEEQAARCFTQSSLYSTVGIQWQKYQGGAIPGGSDTIANPPRTALPCVAPLPPQSLSDPVHSHFPFAMRVFLASFQRQVAVTASIITPPPTL